MEIPVTATTQPRSDEAGISMDPHRQNHETNRAYVRVRRILHINNVENFVTSRVGFEIAFVHALCER